MHSHAQTCTKFPCAKAHQENIKALALGKPTQFFSRYWPLQLASILKNGNNVDYTVGISDSGQAEPNEKQSKRTSIGPLNQTQNCHK